MHDGHRCSICLALVLLSACGQPADTAPSAVAPPLATAVASATANEIAVLRERLSALEARKQAIADSNAIKRLQRSFGYYMSEGQWDEVVALFTEDATLEFGRDGVYVGRDRIRAWLDAYGGGQAGLREGQLNEHLLVMPVVTLAGDGRSAQARWRSIMLLGQFGEQALWGEGPYENTYVKEDGIWKIDTLHWFQTILVPYEGGWAQHEDFNQGLWVSNTLPPDAPATTSYGYWPETFLPPFSFENPVGRYQPPPDADSAEEAVP